MAVKLFPSLLVLIGTLLAVFIGLSKWDDWLLDYRGQIELGTVLQIVEDEADEGEWITCQYQYEVHSMDFIVEQVFEEAKLMEPLSYNSVVEVEYDPSYPSRSRLKGIPISPLPLWSFIIAILMAFGGIFAAVYLGKKHQQNKKIDKQTFKIMFPGLLIFSNILFLLGLFLVQKEFSEHRDLIIHSGVIQQSLIKETTEYFYQPAIEYQYSYQDQFYHSSTIAPNPILFTDRESALQFLKDYPIGEEVEIILSRDHPVISYLIYDYPILEILLAAFGLGATILLLILGWRIKKKLKASS